MQDDKIILEFRKAFQNLNYLKNNLTIPYLYRWTHTWCLEKGILPQLHGDFCELASAYANQELIESYLPEEIRKTRTNEKR